MAQSLTRLHLQTFAILLLCLGTAGYAGFTLLNELEQSHQQKQIALIAGSLSDQIAELIEQQRLNVEKIATRPDIGTLFRRSKTKETARLEMEIGFALPNAAAIHLLQADSSGKPLATASLESVCLDFVTRSAASGPFVEFHIADNLPTHYDLTQPIRDANKNILGYLLVRYPSSLLQNLLKRRSPESGYVELQQPQPDNSTQTVAMAGDKARAASNGSLSSTLNHLPWRLVYQPYHSGSSIFPGKRFNYILFILIAAGVLIAVYLDMQRRTRNFVRHDIKSLVRMFRDVRTGGVRVDYPMKLNEFGNAFKYLRDTGNKMVREKKKLKGMGLIDHLSQLSNRRHFEMKLKELFELSKTHGPSSVLIIDVDHFKAVNDNHGHDAGDALIVGFSEALRKAVRQTDVLARLGGDEFCVIYTYATLEKAAGFVERLRRQLPREIMLTKGIMHTLRWTGGVSAISDEDTKFDDVLWRADQALIQAKETGRNQTEVYDSVKGLKKRTPITF